jgi:hypothetical protein
MTKIEQTQLRASIGGYITKNDIVDLTGYRPYIGGLGDKTTNPDDFVAEGLMKMTPTATFPADVQYVPFSCYKLTMYISYQDSGSLTDNSFIFAGDDSFTFAFMDGRYTTVYGGVEIDSLDKEIRLVDGGMISFTDGVLTDGKAYIATLIVKGDQEAYVKVTEAEGIGYIAYSDGTISAEYDSAKTAVGVVIEATDGVATKIVSLAETTSTKWSTEYVVTNATSKTDGMANLNAIQSISSWEEKYPAFKWCDDYTD